MALSRSSHRRRVYRAGHRNAMERCMISISERTCLWRFGPGEIRTGAEIGDIVREGALGFEPYHPAIRIIDARDVVNEPSVPGAFVVAEIFRQQSLEATGRTCFDRCPSAEPEMQQNAAFIVEMHDLDRAARRRRFTELPSADPSNQRAPSSQMNQTGALRGPSALIVARLAIKGRWRTSSGSKAYPMPPP